MQKNDYLVINFHDPSLLLSPGYEQELQKESNFNNFTIICSNYLKNIRNELLEENNTSLNSQNNEIIYINAEIEGIFAQIMIDTGANVPTINSVELDPVSYTHLDVYKRQLKGLKLGIDRPKEIKIICLISNFSWQLLHAQKGNKNAQESNIKEKGGRSREGD